MREERAVARSFGTAWTGRHLLCGVCRCPRLAQRRVSVTGEDVAPVSKYSPCGHLHCSVPHQAVPRRTKCRTLSMKEASSPQENTQAQAAPPTQHVAAFFADLSSRPMFNVQCCYILSCTQQLSKRSNPPCSSLILCYMYGTRVRPSYL